MESLEETTAQPIYTTAHERAVLLAAIRQFVDQRPNLRRDMYENMAALWRIQRMLSKHKNHAVKMLRYIENDSGVTLQDLLQAFHKEQSHLSVFIQGAHGGPKVSLAPKEGKHGPWYRKYVCEVLADAIWTDFYSTSRPDPRKHLGRLLGANVVRHWFPHA